ncbi:hypothetical protein ACVWYG_002804 [Pedobacter sp. UYEF25]
MPANSLLGKITYSQASLAALFSFIALKLLLPCLLVNPIYELHRDEFLHLDQANHLAWGFQSVPPVTSIFALLIKFLGKSEAVIRLISATIGAATLVFTWKIVGELGGNLYAKSLSAIALICSTIGRLDLLFQPNAFDILSWTALYFFLIKFIKTKKTAFLYYSAICVGIGFLNKYSILFLLAGLLPALIFSSQRTIFKNKHFYFAAFLTLLIMLPNLLWQYNHNFPVVWHMKELAKTQLDKINRIDFLKDQLLYYVNIIFIVFAGLLSLMFSKPFKDYRWIVIGFGFSIFLFIYFRAKSYYAAGLYPIIIAAGCAYFGRVLDRPSLRYLKVLTLIIPVIFFLFILRVSYPFLTPKRIVQKQKIFSKVGVLKWEDGLQHELPQDFADMLGWKELADLTDLAYTNVKDKSTVLVRADNYGEAGAINYYSRFKDINAVSYHADYLNWFKLDKPIIDAIFIFGPYDDDPKRNKEKPFFKKITKIGEVKNPYAREKGTSVFLLEGASEDVTTIIKEEIKQQQHDY